MSVFLRVTLISPSYFFLQKFLAVEKNKQFKASR
jgi:hypothetical protein